MTASDKELGDSSLDIKFGGEVLTFDSSGTIFMAAHSTLIVSDLHFEKGSYFAAMKGSPVPVYDTLETIERLEKVVCKYQPKKIIALGDSFHDRNAGLRLEKTDREKLKYLCAQPHEWVWVLGNHDSDFPKDIPGTTAAHLKLGQLHLSHEYDNMPFSIIGHYHPKAKLSIYGHKIKGRCFVNDGNILIMPSFGAYTGGLEIEAEPIKKLFTTKPKTHLIYNGKIWPI